MEEKIDNIVEHKCVVHKYIKDFVDELKGSDTSKRGASKVACEIIDDIKRKALEAYLTNVFGGMILSKGNELNEKDIDDITDTLVDMAADFYSRFIEKISDGDEKEGERFDDVCMNFLSLIDKKQGND